MGNGAATFTGGARIGSCNATWPLAKLTVLPEKLLLKVAVFGSYEFSSDNVISLSKYCMIPVLGWGVRIEHTVPNYPEKVIFWCLGRPETVLEKIAGNGFQPTASSEHRPERKGWPIRWQAFLGLIVLWNALFLLAAPFEKFFDHGKLNPLVLLPLLAFFGGGLLLRQNLVLQRLILKPGRDVEEIRSWINLIILITGIMTVIFGIVIAFGGNIQPIKR